MKFVRHRSAAAFISASLLCVGVTGMARAGADGTVENVPGSSAAPLTLPPAGGAKPASPGPTTTYPTSQTGPAPAAAEEFALGQAAVANKDWVGAIAAFTKAAALDPANADIENLWAFSLRNTADYQGALTHYAKALKLNPNHRGAHEYLGEAYLALKQPAKAKAELAALKKICGSTCEQYLDLSKSIAAYGKANQAPKKK